MIPKRRHILRLLLLSVASLLLNPSCYRNNQQLDGKTAVKHGKNNSNSQAFTTRQRRESVTEIDSDNDLASATQQLTIKMGNRSAAFQSWFQNGTNVLKTDADANGTILDFAIVGFPKCGTTTMEANLGYLAPMPIADVCTPVHQTVYYAYKNWPKKFPDAQGNIDTKLYRGTKCPALIDSNGVMGLEKYSKYLPRTKLIVGIRHPVLWFSSFWKMQAKIFVGEYLSKTPYDLTQLCGPGEDCLRGCPERKLFCVGRARFHLPLARLGKTPLTDAERALLAPNDSDGGSNIESNRVRNQIFIYEQTELNEEDVWEELARYLQYPERAIPHDLYVSSHGSNKKGSNSTPHTINICDSKYDDLRGLMMPYAYEMSQWICTYFVAAPDVVVANHTRFCSIVRNYANDPCGRLIRLVNGTYVINAANVG